MFDESVHKVSCNWEDTLKFCSIFYDTRYAVSANFMVVASMEAVSMKSCVNLEKSATKTLAMIK